MKNSRVIHFLAKQEQTLDTILFGPGVGTAAALMGAGAAGLAYDKMRRKNPNHDPGTNTGRPMGGSLAIGGGTVLAGKLADNAVMKKYGTRSLLNQGASGPLGAHNRAPAAAGGTASIGRGAAYGAAAKDAAASVGNRLNSGVRAGRHAASVLAEDGQGAVRSTLGGIQKGAKVALNPVLSRLKGLALKLA